MCEPPEPRRIDIEIIREKVEKGEFSYVGHAIVEARKDGITPHDVRFVLLTGEIIEEYPERYRCLVYGVNRDNIPVHVSCEYYDYLLDASQDILVVTVYVPDREEWIADRIRKRKKRR